MRDETADIYARVHNRADEILHYVWDPIGIAGTPQARDEYDSYVPEVVRMLFAGADSETIAKHLHALETDHIGLTRFGMVSKATRRAAELLTTHFQWIKSREAERAKG
jgi:hypothetical protein